jgi:hypothetical protein
MHELPIGFYSIGRSSHCGLQGIWKKGRVLTYQGHAEFDKFINRETLKVFGQLIWEDKFLAQALEQVEKDDDAVWAASAMLKFFLEDPETRDVILKRSEVPVEFFLNIQIEKMSKLLQYLQEIWSNWLAGSFKSKEHSS